jgi:hypothetical protein
MMAPTGFAPAEELLGTTGAPKSKSPNAEESSRWYFESLAKADPTTPNERTDESKIPFSFMISPVLSYMTYI